MNSTVLLVLNFSLLIMVFLLPFSFLRVWIGRGAADRMLALEATSAVLICIVILLSLIEGTDTTLDVGIILSALGFAGTMSIARYISEGRVF